MKYLKVTDEATAKLISKSLYTLTINKNWDCKSEYLLSWSQDASNEWYLHWDLAAVLPVNTGRNTAMNLVLQQFVTAGFLTAESAALITAKIQENQPVTLAEITPAEWVLADSVEMVGGGE